MKVVICSSRGAGEMDAATVACLYVCKGSLGFRSPRRIRGGNRGGIVTYIQK